MNKYHVFFAVFYLSVMQATANAAPGDKPITTTSPNGKLAIHLATGEKINLSVSYMGKEVMSPSPQGLIVKEFPGAFGNPQIKKVATREVNEVIIPAVPEKRSRIPDVFNETEIWFKGNYGIKIRAYDDGVAWRFVTAFKDSITVLNELVTIGMAIDDSVYFGEEEKFLSHSERLYLPKAVAELKEKQMCVLPAVFRKADGLIAAFSEADLLDYPGLYLTASSQAGIFNGILPQAAATESISKDKRSYMVDSRHEYLARTKGSREFPWRVMAIAGTDAGLLENDIIYRLGSPCRLAETSWIKPGKVAWDWWNDWNIYHVPFKAGINTETYKYYIDFASAYGLEYVIFDEGWSSNDDLDKINPDMDMEALFAYARQKNVGIILWVTGRALEEKFGSSFDKFQQWGCAGIKMDFMIRDDQRMVNFYEKVAAEAAKRHMLVDYHGSYKPTGLSRTYPNQLTREGLKGLENSKWGDLITPEHDCTLPYTRMFAGAMDYTPGAMDNAVKKEFKASWSEPMSQGTRCHELAKYIIYESPLQMLCDAPTKYMQEPETMKFLSDVPVTWDETIGLAGKVGKYVAVARKKGDAWYIGCMTGWDSRELTLRLDFLGEGEYIMETWQDGPNADRRAEDFSMEQRTVTRNSVITLHMAPGGGYVARVASAF
jgi:alpha-glucosidase